MKNQLLILALATVALTACGGGGGSSTPIYLPAGTYSQTFTNLQSTCQGFTPSTDNWISNGAGQICNSADLSNCATINLANNPCLSETESESGVTATLAYNNCQLTSNGMTIEFNFHANGDGTQCSITANDTMTLISESGESGGESSSNVPPAQLSAEKTHSLFGFTHLTK